MTTSASVTAVTAHPSARPGGGACAGLVLPGAGAHRSAMVTEDSSIAPDRADLGRLRDFITAFATVVDEAGDEGEILKCGTGLLAALIAHDDWLPQDFARPDPARYRQYLLHCDSRERFSVVSFVWGPGQSTPIHDHTVWGLVGVLRGGELVERFHRDAEGDLVSSAPPALLQAGAVDAFGPALGDIHRVANAQDDRVSISIHVYGANIGAVERATYDPAGRPSSFISGYANAVLPNLWDRSSR